MIVTHTRNANGHRRVYLGGKSSLECWIEPKADNIGWTFHVDRAVTGNQLTDADTKAWAIHTLLKLSQALQVAPADLAAVPYERIAALHTGDPFAGRRIASGRRASIDHGFLSTPPNIRRPAGDFRQADQGTFRQRP